MIPTEPRGFEKSGNQASESSCRQNGSCPIYLFRFRSAAFRNRKERYRENGRCRRQVQKEGPAPRGILNEQSAEDGTKGAGNRSEAGPDADGSTARVFVERSADDRETARNQQRRANPLNATRDDELVDV